MADELALDLEELRQLQNLAKRPRVLSLISSEIRNLEKVRCFLMFGLLFIYFFFLILDYVSGAKTDGVVEMFPMKIRLTDLFRLKGHFLE